MKVNIILNKKPFRFLISIIFIFLMGSCELAPTVPNVNDMTFQAATRIAEPEIAKILSDEAPIHLSSSGVFPVVGELPPPVFNPVSSFQKRIVYLSDGRLALVPGDYIIPVMTFCMKTSGISPRGHGYVLNTLQGTRATIIRNINLRAFPQFDSHDVQILSWSIQNGLSYNEMTRQSQQIVDAIIPESKKDLQESSLDKIAEGWNKISAKSAGILPEFEQASDDILNAMGESGITILEMKRFRQRIKENGNDYSSLSRLIPITNQKVQTHVGSWSRVSNQVYIRFVTKGAYQEVGQIQIRVLSLKNKRKISSKDDARIFVDLALLVGDPQDPLVQPLSFAPLLGVNGILVPFEISETPIIVAALMAATLYQEIINWDSFQKIADISVSLEDPTVSQLLKHGINLLQEAHDDLERPARDVGVIDEKTKNTTEDKKGSVREYTKSGGEEGLKKDFDKFPGDKTSSTDKKVETKILPDGKKIVSRSSSSTTPTPTLEIQPPDNGKYYPGLRIKVRYP